MKCLCLVVLFFALIHAQNTQNCGYDTVRYPKQPTYCGLKAITDFPFESKRSGPPVCIVIGQCDYRNPDAPPNATLFQPLYKIVFWPKCDVFTLLEINDAFINHTVRRVTVDNNGTLTNQTVFDYVMNNTSLAISIEIGQVTSTPQPIYSFPCTDESCFTVPFFTAIAEVDGNYVKGITWDDAGCFNCDGAACIEGFCGINTWSQCNHGPDKEGGSFDCDIKVYFGWFGADSRGNYLTSAGQRFSAFRSYSLATAYDSAAATIAAEKPSFPSDLPNQFDGTNFDDSNSQPAP
jgi:hypothetical protein